MKTEQQQANLEELSKPLDAKQAAAVWDEVSAAGGDKPLADGVVTDGDKSGARPAKVAPAAAAAAAPAAEPKLQDVLDAVKGATTAVTDLGKRVRGVEGHVGTLKDGLTKVSGEVTAFAAAAKAAPAGMAAPSATQIQAAAASPEKWERLKKEFPEIADATEALVTTVRGEVDGKVKAALEAASKAAPAVDLTPINEAITGLKTALSAKDIENAELHVEIYHRGWKRTVASKEFGGWLETAAPEVKALSESDKPSDAIRMLDLYEEAKKEAEAAARVGASRDSRLQRAAAGNVPGQRKQGAPAAKSAEEMSAKELWDTDGRAAYEQARGRAA